MPQMEMRLAEAVVELGEDLVEVLPVYSVAAKNSTLGLPAHPMLTLMPQYLPFSLGWPSTIRALMPHDGEIGGPGGAGIGFLDAAGQGRLAAHREAGRGRRRRCR